MLSFSTEASTFTDAEASTTLYLEATSTLQIATSSTCLLLIPLASETPIIGNPYDGDVTTISPQTKPLGSTDAKVDLPFPITFYDTGVFEFYVVFQEALPNEVTYYYETMEICGNPQGLVGASSPYGKFRGLLLLLPLWEDASLISRP